MIKHNILSISGKELPAELGKYIWLSKADTDALAGRGVQHALP